MALLRALKGYLDLLSRTAGLGAARRKLVALMEHAVAVEELLSRR